MSPVKKAYCEILYEVDFDESHIQILHHFKIVQKKTFRRCTCRWYNGEATRFQNGWPQKQKNKKHTKIEN